MSPLGRKAARLPLALTAVAALVAVTAAAAPPAQAQAPSFVAEVDRTQVAPEEGFTYEVTLNIAQQNITAFQPPDFRGLTVLQAPRGPNRATHMQIGGGGTFIQNSLTWEYQVAPTAGQKGVITIGSARVRIDGREMRSNPVSIRVGGSPTPGGNAIRPGRRGFPTPVFPGLRQPTTPPPVAAPPASPGPSSGAPPLASASAANFIRVAPDKTTAYVGEQITVGWYLYLTQGMDNYETVSEPRTDAFWTEDVTPNNVRKGLTLTQEQAGGRNYQVAMLFKKALFPLQPGKLTISPMESQVAQVDFFGATLRKQRLKAEATVIEAIALPKADQPPGFDANNVGRFTIAARVDRTMVGVGEAVTFTIDIKGEGNVRNVRPPVFAPIDGWKRYEPKINVTIDPGDTVSGTKSLEYLLLPERPGVTMLTSLSLPYFDPQAKAYAAARSEPIRLEVTGGAVGRDRTTAGISDGKSAAGVVENVISAEIRPIRARPAPRRDLGATFYRSSAFLGILLAPPLGLALTILFARVRERLGGDTKRTRRRRVRTMIRRRLSAAEDHRDGNRTSDFYIEIDRVVREVLAARLGRTVAGLRMDELRELLRRRGMPDAIVGRTIAELEDCDQARFAPGSSNVGRERMSASLERAGDLIVAIEKAPLRDEAA
ncbi:MAG TPA: BatD family protein [Polyangia bacterium]|jgi:hypothetical protein|nr:BatD family protein [Polyangia bacterium]